MDSERFCTAPAHNRSRPSLGRSVQRNKFCSYSYSSHERCGGFARIGRRVSHSPSISGTRARFLQRNISVECRSGRHPFAGVNRCRWASCAPPHNQVKGEGDEADACASRVFPSNTIGVFTRTVSEIFQGCQGDDARWSHARRRGHRAAVRLGISRSRGLCEQRSHMLGRRKLPVEVATSTSLSSAISLVSRLRTS